MATLAVGTVNRTGLNLVTQDVAASGGGDEFPNAGVEFVYFNNNDAGAKVVTFVTSATQDGLAVADRAVTVPANTQMLVGPFPAAIYNNVNNRVAMTYDGVTGLTVAVAKLLGT